MSWFASILLHTYIVQYVYYYILRKIRIPLRSSYRRSSTIKHLATSLWQRNVTAFVVSVNKVPLTCDMLPLNAYNIVILLYNVFNVIGRIREGLSLFADFNYSLCRSYNTYSYVCHPDLSLKAIKMLQYFSIVLDIS